MTRLDPKETTVKKLFALSGNLCAFPECQQMMVDEDIVVGVICHIEAAERGGERYNPQQTDEERRSFENLMLLCGNHHSITNNVGKYPVEALRRMKADHEKKYINARYQASRDSIKEAINIYRSTQANINLGSGPQYNIVHQGMNVSEVASLFRELFEANFPRLREMAEVTAIEHVDKFADIFLEKLKYSLNHEDLQVFSEPDVQFVLNHAIQIVSRKGDQEVMEHLSNLLLDRIKNNNQDLLVTILDEAILTIGKLTHNQLVILGLIFTIQEYVIHKEIKSWQDLNEYYGQYVNPFLDVVLRETDFRHLEYAGCASFNRLGAGNLADTLMSQFIFLFFRPVTINTLHWLNLPKDTLRQLFVRPDINKNAYVFRDADAYKSYTTLYHPKIKNYQVYSMFTLDSSNDSDSADESGLSEAMRKVLTEINIGYKVDKIIQSSRVGSLTLTSVGLAIGATFCAQLTGEAINIKIILAKQN